MSADFPCNHYYGRKNTCRVGIYLIKNNTEVEETVIVKKVHIGAVVYSVKLTNESILKAKYRTYIIIIIINTLSRRAVHSCSRKYSVNGDLACVLAGIKACQLKG